MSVSKKLFTISFTQFASVAHGRTVKSKTSIDTIFDDFETWVLESKLIRCMTDLGHKNHISVFVVTGNGNGLAEFVVAKAPVQKAALKIANNRANLRLMYILRYKEHTGMNRTGCFK
ncbi:hypothetical protein P5V15_005857 [Pogonomyrmex californicus]